MISFIYNVQNRQIYNRDRRWTSGCLGLAQFCQENTLVTANTLFPTDNSTHGHHQMVNTEITLIIFFVAEYGEVLYSQQKLDLELTVAQLIDSLL